MTFRLLSLAAGTALLTLSTVALAQETPPPRPAIPPMRTIDPPQAARATTQPQGPTGPIDTSSGGMPAANPQGDTPAGMQTQPQDPTGQTGRGDPDGR